MLRVVRASTVGARRRPWRSAPAHVASHPLLACAEDPGASSKRLWVGEPTRGSGSMQRARGPSSPALVLAGLVIEALVVALAGAAAVGLSLDIATDRGMLVVALLALGVGPRSATVRRLDVPELTTTVVTSTITALAADRDVRRAGLARRLSRIALGLRLLGAVAGALLAARRCSCRFCSSPGLIALAAAVYVASVVARERRRGRSSDAPRRHA
jgi:hypothetical protein